MLQTSYLFNDFDPDTQLAEGLWVSSLKLMSFKSGEEEEAQVVQLHFWVIRSGKTHLSEKQNVSVLVIFSAIFYSTLILEKESTKHQLVFSCSGCRSFKSSGPQTRTTLPMVDLLSLYQKTFQ